MGVIIVPTGYKVPCKVFVLVFSVYCVHECLHAHHVVPESFRVVQGLHHPAVFCIHYVFHANSVHRDPKTLARP